MDKEAAEHEPPLGADWYGGVGNIEYHPGGMDRLHGLQRCDRTAGITVVNPGHNDRLLLIVFDTCTEILDPVG